MIVLLRLSAPIDPDAETARRWVQDELEKSDYHSSSNDWFARVLEWIAKLLNKQPDFGNSSAPGGVPAWVVTALIIVIVLAIAAFLVMGPLRSSGRRKKTKAIFDDDTRNLDAIKNAALEAASIGDWSRATLERFRAIVRAGEDQGIVSVTPGMTADEFARDAAHSIRALEVEFDWAADTFDGLRYADARARQADYERMTALEVSVSASDPVTDAV